MTNPTLFHLDHLDGDQLVPIDSQVPAEYRRLPPDFWERRWVEIKVAGGRL